MLVTALAIATASLAATASPDASAVVTRREFVGAAEAWLHAMENKSKRSFKHPKETILVYFDVPQDFKEHAIDLETNYRLFEGVDRFSYGTFGPKEPMMRLQAVQLIKNLVILVEQDGTKALPSPAGFSDVPLDPVTAASLKLLLDRRILVGFPDQTLRPGDPLTRAQFEALSQRMGQYIDRMHP